MSTGYLFLRFDPPATAAQLAVVIDLAFNYDEDMPAKRFGADGTGRCQYGRDVGSEHGVYWRKPGFEAQQKTIEFLESAGISGHGWLVEEHWPHQIEVRDEGRFTFGDCPAMRLRIDKARALNKAGGAVYAAAMEMVEAAKKGDDHRLPELAQAIRDAVAAEAALKGAE